MISHCGYSCRVTATGRATHGRAWAATHDDASPSAKVVLAWCGCGPGSGRRPYARCGLKVAHENEAGLSSHSHGLAFSAAGASPTGRIASCGIDAPARGVAARQGRGFITQMQGRGVGGGACGSNSTRGLGRLSNYDDCFDGAIAARGSLAVLTVGVPAGGARGPGCRVSPITTVPASIRWRGAPARVALRV